IGTLLSIRSLPPRCMRKVRSETRSTTTPSRPRSASGIVSACSFPRVAQVTSTRTRSAPDAVTSSAVTIPPSDSIRPVSSLTARGRAGSSSRIVTEEETLAPFAMAPSCPRSAARERHHDEDDGEDAEREAQPEPQGDAGAGVAGDQSPRAHQSDHGEHDGGHPDDRHEEPDDAEDHAPCAGATTDD